jgi:hypothetical protein
MVALKAEKMVDKKDVTTAALMAEKMVVISAV